MNGTLGNRLNNNHLYYSLVKNIYRYTYILARVVRIASAYRVYVSVCLCAASLRVCARACVRVVGFISCVCVCMLYISQEESVSALVINLNTNLKGQLLT